MIYDYRIADILIRCDLPFEISISQESREFISSMSCQVPDLYFVFRLVRTLPDVPENAVTQGRTHNVTFADGYGRYYYNYPNHAPYAYVSWRASEPQLLLCEYISGAEHDFSDSRSILNMMGLEIVLLQHDSLLVHSSLIRVDGKAILFTAPSGTGKSTQADLWMKIERADILNGDRSALRKMGKQWTAYGLPYAGTSGIFRNASAPVAAIAVLRQAKSNRIRRLDIPESMRFIYPELTLHRWESESVDLAMNLLMGLLSQIPVFLLECLPDDGAVKTLKQELLNGGFLA